MTGRGAGGWAKAARRGLPAIAAFAVGAARLGAQQARAPNEAQPERPTVATHAGTVAPGWWEAEEGLELDGVDQRTPNLAMPLELKLGMARRLQLSLGVDPVIAGVMDVGDVSVGLKWRFFEQSFERSAVLPSVVVPLQGRPAGAGVLLIWSHQAGPVEIDANAGYMARGGDGARVPTSSSVWTVSAGGPVAGKWGWTGEVFGYPKTAGAAGSAAKVGLLGGPTLQVSPETVLDAGVIVPLSGPQPLALYAGVTGNLGRFAGR